MSKMKKTARKIGRRYETTKIKPAELPAGQAGKVYQTLKQRGPKTVLELVKATGITAGGNGYGNVATALSRMKARRLVKFA